MRGAGGGIRNGAVGDDTATGAGAGGGTRGGGGRSTGGGGLTGGGQLAGGGGAGAAGGGNSNGGGGCCSGGGACAGGGGGGGGGGDGSASDDGTHSTASGKSVPEQVVHLCTRGGQFMAYHPLGRGRAHDAMVGIARTWGIRLWQSGLLCLLASRRRCGTHRWHPPPGGRIGAVSACGDRVGGGGTGALTVPQLVPARPPGQTMPVDMHVGMSELVVVAL